MRESESDLRMGESDTASCHNEEEELLYETITIIQKSLAFKQKG